MDAPSDGLERVTRDAASRGVAIEIRARAEVTSLAEAAHSLGIEPDDIAKTIVIRAGSSDYLFAVVPGTARVAWPKLRALLGVSKLKFPSAEDAFEVVGYEHGTITPLGSARELPVYIDATLVGRRVGMGSGTRDHTVFVEVDDLVRGFEATVADIADRG